MRRRAAHITAVLAGLFLLALAVPADAGVTVSGTDAVPGGYATLTFHVVSDRSSPTTKVEVLLPVSRPLASVAVRPQLAWAYAVTKTPAPPGFAAAHGGTSRIVSRVTWQAVRRGIKPGEFEDFSLTVGPLPRVPLLSFPVLQTYKNGAVVAWNQTGPGRHTNPAPVLRIALPPAPTPTPTVSAAPSVLAEPTPEPVAADDDRSRRAELLAAIGAGGAGVALALAAAALLRSGRRG